MEGLSAREVELCYVAISLLWGNGVLSDEQHVELHDRIMQMERNNEEEE